MTTRDKALDNWKHHVAASVPCDPAAMNLRIARFAEIPASPRAFVETWIDGAGGQAHTVVLNPCDTISVPPRVHRSFRSLDGDAGMLISILGGKVPDRVKRHSGLEQRARAIGAGFDDDGNAVKFD